MDKIKGVYMYCKYLDARNQNTKGVDVYCDVILKDILSLYEYELDCYLSEHPEDEIKASMFYSTIFNKLSAIYLYGCNDTFINPPKLYSASNISYFDSNTIYVAAKKFVDVVKYTVKELNK